MSKISKQATLTFTDDIIKVYSKPNKFFPKTKMNIRK